MQKTLKQWRAGIKQEVPYVGIKPYSHNIISLSLSVIAKRWGWKSANKAIRDFDLEELGWKQRLGDET